MERGQFIKRIAQAAVLGSAIEAATFAPIVGASADQAPINVNCDPKITTGKDIVQGNTYLVKASGVIMSADASVDGAKQFDNDGNTASVVAMKSVDNSDKTWKIFADYNGHLDILKCGVGSNDLYLAFGRTQAVVDQRNGQNDPIHRVDTNFIKK